jgi:hypothetical protein
MDDAAVNGLPAVGCVHALAAGREVKGVLPIIIQNNMIT